MFVPKADGFKSIRIPAVVVTKKGTVLAFAEGRAANTDQAKNKIILKPQHRRRKDLEQGRDHRP